MVFYDTYNLASATFQKANSSIYGGKLDEAEERLSSAYSLALSVDAKDLLTRICLSGITLNLNCLTKTGLKTGGSFTGRFLGLESVKLLELAEDYARLSEKADFLLAVCRIFSAELVIASNPSVKLVDDAVAELYSAQKNLSGDSYYLGCSFRVLGDLFVAKKDFAAAENSYLSAVKLHSRSRSVSDLAVDWYYIARCRSLGGKKTAAIQAIDSALMYDRNAENSFGIASDYFAKAKIVLKFAESDAERREAARLFKWSCKVFEAGGFLEQAKQVRDFADGK